MIYFGCLYVDDKKKSSCENMRFCKIFEILSPTLLRWILLCAICASVVICRWKLEGKVEDFDINNFVF